MSDFYSGSDHKEWEAAGLKDFGDFAECVTYCNQEDFGDVTEGEWFYADDEAKTIYHGSFGNYNSPGSYIYADVFDDEEEYQDAVEEWESNPEYVESDDWDDFPDDDNDDYDDEDECYDDDFMPNTEIDC